MQDEGRQTGRCEKYNDLIQLREANEGAKRNLMKGSWGVQAKNDVLTTNLRRKDI